MKLVYTFLLVPLLAGCPSGKCGDNTQDANEACDDGNTNDADGCEADCSLPACKNGIQDPGELCFAAPATFPTDNAPQEPATADFNGDGHQDIITANAAGSSVSVLVGSGTGELIRLADVDLGSPSIFVTVGDFDGDQLPDFAATLPVIDTIEVFRGLGNGTFEPLASLSADNSPLLLTADMNNDGAQDIVASSNDGVVLFLNDGVGSFDAPRISFIGSFPTIAAADFDGDSNTDIAAGADGDLILLLGDGIGNLAPQPAQLTGQVPGRITAADFNEDQLPDLAGTDFTADGSIKIFTNQAGTFSPQAQSFSVANPFALAASDLNADGTQDIAVASNLDATLNSHLVTITSEGNIFRPQDPLLVGNVDLKGITTADFNEDQLPDVAVTDTNNNLVVLFLSQP